MELEEQHGSGTNAVERFAVSVVMRHGGDSEAAPHRWSEDDLSEIHAIERNTVLLAALAGATSGALIGMVEVLYRGRLDLAQIARYWQAWTVFLVVAVVVSAVEIGLLYWLVLRRASRVASIAGLGLSRRERETVIALGVSRASLEMPNPRTSIYGIDPYASVPRWQLLAYTALYRLKIGVTSFVLRIVLRRLLARATLRVFIPLISVPVYAAWNAVVIRWVMREVRIRAAGPRAIEEIREWIAESERSLDAEARGLIVQAVAECITRARDAHPNFVLLLDRLLRDLELTTDRFELDWSDARRRIAELDETTQRLVLRVTIGTAVLSGRIRRRQHELLAELHELCGASYTKDEVGALRESFMRGQGLPA